MASSSQASVYTGPWTDWSHSPVYGATITLTNRSSAFLLAFLALYVSIAGGQFWSIVRFFFHQLRATKKPPRRDALFHQEQVILKNDSSPSDVAKELFNLAFAWRKAVRRPFLGILTPFISALLISVGFFLAGIFSSEVTQAAGDSMLIRSPTCGYWFYEQTGPQFIYNAMDRILNESLTAAEYAKTCYDNSQSQFRCNSFVTQQIPWKVNRNATCPFAPGTCVYGDTAALELDTGPLDSHDLFGLNAPKSKRITYRKVTTCAPISLEGHSRLENVTVFLNERIETPVWRYYYGPGGGGNWTYQYYEQEFMDGIGYHLASLSDGATWEPAEQFSRSDANVTILFLAQNSVGYQNQVDDPWFGAHYVEQYDAEGKYKYYVEDQWVTVLGCVDQHQFCNPNHPEFDGKTKGCTALGTLTQIYQDLPDLDLNDFQQTILSHLKYPLVFASIFFSVTGRGASALRANNMVYELASNGLPPTQWMTEVSGWFALILARIQGAFVEYAAGPGPLGPGEALLSQNSSIEKTVCRSQKVPAKEGYQNFSVLGISIIVGLGTLFNIVGLTIDSIVGWLQTKFKKGQYGRLSWKMDNKLQLQRMAYEGAGWEPWKKLDGSVPIKEGDTAVGLYDNKDHILPFKGGKGASGAQP